MFGVKYLPLLLEDTHALSRALAGAKGAHLLIPPNYRDRGLSFGLFRVHDTAGGSSIRKPTAVAASWFARTWGSALILDSDARDLRRRDGNMIVQSAEDQVHPTPDAT